MSSTVYIGRPGRLVAIPSPLRGLSATRERPITVHRGPNGARRVDRGSGRRTYTMSWPYLSHDLLSAVEVFAQGHAGPGPYALLDPTRRNHLSVYQSSGGSNTVDGPGFTVAGGETVEPQSDVAYRGPAAFRWTLPTPVTSGILSLDGPSIYRGFPWPDNEPAVFTARVSGGGADPAATVTPVLSWQAADGFEVSATLGAEATTAAGVWTQVSVSRTAPPPGAVYLVPQLRITPGSVDAGSSGVGSTSQRTPRLAHTRGMDARLFLPRSGDPVMVTDWVFGSDAAVYVDELQLSMSTSVLPWAAGTGVPIVSWTALPDVYTLATVHAVQATLMEVG